MRILFPVPSAARARGPYAGGNEKMSRRRTVFVSDPDIFVYYPDITRLIIKAFTRWHSFRTSFGGFNGDFYHDNLLQLYLMRTLTTTGKPVLVKHNYSVIH